MFACLFKFWGFGLFFITAAVCGLDTATPASPGEGEGHLPASPKGCHVNLPVRPLEPN